MKNFIIISVVVVIGGLGFFMFSKQNTSDKTATTSNGSSLTEADSSKASGGSTIDLSSQGLSKISKDILDDSSVTTLDVSGNQLTGALPAEIRKLTNLEVLNASNNNMTGIPAEIGQLAKLRVANFANNDISGLPMEIGNLKNLETFDLRGNPSVSKQDLSQIQSKLPNAKFLTD